MAVPIDDQVTAAHRRQVGGSGDGPGLAVKAQQGPGRRRPQPARLVLRDVHHVAQRPTVGGGRERAPALPVILAEAVCGAKPQGPIRRLEDD